jgi:hypothetical protein
MSFDGEGQRPQDLLNDNNSTEQINEGGDLCITPPSKSHNNNHNNNYSILSSGIDTLVLSMYVTWKDESLFEYLENLKNEAQAIKEPKQGKLGVHSSEDSWCFNIMTHGSKGYAYVLVAKDYTLKMVRTREPGSMPNVLIEIRSETLWTLGVIEAVNRIIKLIKRLSISINKIKPNRVDLCVDFEMPEDEWSTEILKKKVTRARKSQVFMENDVLTGIQIGSGDLLVRIYDKAHEIEKISKKQWMYVLWVIDKPREGTKIIRIEFQIRRPILKAFGIILLEDLYREINSLWAYLTQHWLKFLETPEKNLDRQTVLPWWQAVQAGYGEKCEPAERIRHISVRMEQEQIAKRALSFLVYLMASEISASRLDQEGEWSLDDIWKVLVWQLHRMEISDDRISEMIKRKIPEYQRQDGEEVPF